MIDKIKKYGNLALMLLAFGCSSVGSKAVSENENKHVDTLTIVEPHINYINTGFEPNKLYDTAKIERLWQIRKAYFHPAEEGQIKQDQEMGNPYFHSLDTFYERH